MADIPEIEILRRYEFFKNVIDKHPEIKNLACSVESKKYPTISTIFVWSDILRQPVILGADIPKSQVIQGGYQIGEI